ncbi:MAG: N-acetylmuramoyl-L-alanine amidase [Chloroflexia bacterium]
MRLREIADKLSPRGRRAILLASTLLIAATLIGMGFLIARPTYISALAGNSHSQPHPTADPSLAVEAPGVHLTPTQPGQGGAPAPGIAKTPLPLLGRRIGLDPGHGPRDDLGAVFLDPETGKVSLSEAEFNLDVALRCRDILRARGASVVLTRENAKTFTAPWPVDANDDGVVGGSKDDLQARVDILNAFRAEVFLSIHANSARNRKDLGKVQIFYCATSDCAFAAEGQRLSRLLMDQLETRLAAANYPVLDPEIHRDTWPDGLHLFVLGPASPPAHVRATRMPGALAETFYVTSPTEAAQLKRDSVRQAIALAYADALQAFLLGAGPH